MKMHKDMMLIPGEVKLEVKEEVTVLTNHTLTGKVIRHRQAVVAFVVDSKTNQSHKHEPLYPCVFCKGSHFNDNCDEVKTVADHKRLFSN